MDGLTVEAASDQIAATLNPLLAEVLTRLEALETYAGLRKARPLSTTGTLADLIAASLSNPKEIE